MTDPRRHAKIVCTIGPASISEAVLKRMLLAGMDVARLNFSHGTHEDHARVAERLRSASRSAGRTVALLQDLQGPKLRVGAIEPHGLRLNRGQRFVLTTRRGVCGADRVSVSYPQLPRDVKRGDRILVDDGAIQLRVAAVRAADVTCTVEIGGILRSHKGINIPGRPLSVPALTAKDRRDLRLGAELGVDFVALSFVREAADVKQLRRALQRLGSDAAIIAKLEKPQAVDNLESIVDAADGIMVARGDLGVELPPERVPLLQKEMIATARLAGKPVITATQMLESMVQNSRPTRAEASDVANAVFDGTDAVMLSAETAVGRYPVQAIRMMVRIIKTAEAGRVSKPYITRTDEVRCVEVADSIAKGAARAAHDLGARLIAVFTSSGATSRLVSKHRPTVPIYAFTTREKVARQLRMLWGVHPRRVRQFQDTDEMVDTVVEALRKERRVRRGDLIVITAGTPVGRPGTTNFFKVHRVD